MRFLAAIVASLVCIAPLTSAGPAAAQAAGRPNQGLATTVLTVKTATGLHRYTVEIAATPEQQQTGMMYRRSMPRDRGMLFPVSPPRTASFWMRNTWLPLDLVFIAPGGRVLNVGTGTPLSESFIESAGPVAAVLEINAGEAVRIGLKPGDRVRWGGRPVDAAQRSR
jgi:hypothetical protein